MSESNLFPLLDVLQMHGHGRRTGKLCASFGHWGGEIFLSRGSVVHAQVGALRGGDALFIILQNAKSAGDWVMDSPAPVHTMNSTVEEVLIQLAYQEERSSQEIEALLASGETSEGEAGIDRNTHVLGFVVSSETFDSFRFDMDIPELIVGREPDESHVVVPDESVSSKHACLRDAGTKIVFEDLGSTNGSRLGDSLVTHCELLPGQSIRLGSVSMELHVFAKEAPPQVADVPLAGEDEEDEEPSFFKIR